MKALIVIDVQNDFCHGGSLAVPGGEQVVPVINRLAGQFEFIAATKDWHPENHISFAAAHGKSPGEMISLDSGNQILWPDHCVQGTAGSDFHPDLDVRPFRAVIHKGTTADMDSYSAFYENDRFTHTGLTSYLRELDISEVFLCGLATDYCVFFSAMDAVREGFQTRVYLEACRAVGIPENSEKAAVERMREAGVEFPNV